MLISGYTAAVVRRAGALAGEADGIARACLRGQHFLHVDLVFPAVTEVVFVHQRVARGGDTVEAHVALALGLRIAHAVGIVADEELVHVGVGPAHRRLDYPVELTELGVAGHLDAPPDRRVTVPEGDFDLIDIPVCHVFSLRFSVINNHRIKS